MAAYNVENLFDRAKAMSLQTWEEGRPILERFARLSELLGDIRRACDAQHRARDDAAVWVDIDL
jgi:hypothetical protein